MERWAKAAHKTWWIDRVKTYCTKLIKLTEIHGDWTHPQLLWLDQRMSQQWWRLYHRYSVRGFVCVFVCVADGCSFKSALQSALFPVSQWVTHQGTAHSLWPDCQLERFFPYVTGYSSSKGFLSIFFASHSYFTLILCDFLLTSWKFCPGILEVAGKSPASDFYLTFMTWSFVGSVVLGMWVWSQRMNPIHFWFF